jgi:hypothetical protein
MSDRLSLSQVAALVAYGATTAGGQLLFETPALRGAGDGPLAERIAGFLPNGYFFVALILYATLTVLWVWIWTSGAPAWTKARYPGCHIDAGVDHHVSQTRTDGRRGSREHAVPSDGLVERFSLA